MANGIPLSLDRKADFIAELAHHGIVRRVARAASPQSLSGELSTFEDERERDAAIAEAWDKAVETARAEVEHELYRRAQEGYDEPVFGGKYREQIVGTVRRYSNRLLELRARAMLPAYREAAALTVNKRVTHDLDIGLLGDAVASVAMRLAITLGEPTRHLTLIEAEPARDA